jgi:hypothetical protein
MNSSTALVCVFKKSVERSWETPDKEIIPHNEAVSRKETYESTTWYGLKSTRDVIISMEARKAFPVELHGSPQEAVRSTVDSYNALYEIQSSDKKGQTVRITKSSQDFPNDGWVFKNRRGEFKLVCDYGRLIER